MKHTPKSPILSILHNRPANTTSNALTNNITNNDFANNFASISIADEAIVTIL